MSDGETVPVPIGRSINDDVQEQMKSGVSVYIAFVATVPNDAKTALKKWAIVDTKTSQRLVRGATRVWLPNEALDLDGMAMEFEAPEEVTTHRFREFVAIDLPGKVPRRGEPVTLKDMVENVVPSGYKVSGLFNEDKGETGHVYGYIVKTPPGYLPHSLMSGQVVMNSELAQGVRFTLTAAEGGVVTGSGKDGALTVDTFPAASFDKDGEFNGVDSKESQAYGNLGDNERFVETTVRDSSNLWTWFVRPADNVFVHRIFAVSSAHKIGAYLFRNYLKELVAYTPGFPVRPACKPASAKEIAQLLEWHSGPQQDVACEVCFVRRAQHTCAACKATAYCSAQCQEVAWGELEHSKQCCGVEFIATSRPPMDTTDASANSAKHVVSPVTFIDSRVIQSELARYVAFVVRVDRRNRTSAVSWSMASHVGQKNPGKGVTPVNPYFLGPGFFTRDAPDDRREYFRGRESSRGNYEFDQNIDYMVLPLPLTTDQFNVYVDGRAKEYVEMGMQLNGFGASTISNEIVGFLVQTRPGYLPMDVETVQGWGDGRRSTADPGTRTYTTVSMSVPAQSCWPVSSYGPSVVDRRAWTWFVQPSAGGVIRETMPGAYLHLGSTSWARPIESYRASFIGKQHEGGRGYETDVVDLSPGVSAKEPTACAVAAK